MELYNFGGEEYMVVMKETVPLFRANEIATALQFKKPQNAILNHVHEEDLFSWEDIKLDTIDKIPLSRRCYKDMRSDTKFINESGIWALMLGSKKTEAVKFKHWVTSEVLPSIRKMGKYEMTPERRLSLLKDGLSILKDLGPLDERDALFIKTEVKNVLMNDVPTTNKRREVPISDRIVQLGYKYRAKDKKTCMAIGVAMKNAYFEKHGCAPPKREQWVEGATRMVCCYTESDFPLLDPIIKKHYKNL